MTEQELFDKWDAEEILGTIREDLKGLKPTEQNIQELEKILSEFKQRREKRA